MEPGLNLVHTTRRKVKECFSRLLHKQKSMFIPIQVKIYYRNAVLPLHWKFKFLIIWIAESNANIHHSENTKVQTKILFISKDL